MRLLAAAAQGEGFHVPPVEELFGWKPFTTFAVGGITFRVTFLVIVMFATTLLLMLLFMAAFSRPKIVPTGLQNALEAGVGFVREQIMMPTLGPGGEHYLPLLTTMFFFILSLNLLEIVPPVNFPVTSRMAFPAFLAIMTYVIFNAVGIHNQGFFGYFKGMLFPPGVPKPIYVILTPVEFMSTLIFRPLTLAVRLLANMMAGHVMLTVFFLASAYFLYRADSIFLRIVSPFPIILSVVLVGFELFIGAIQAFIFTILTAVYIAGAQHPEH